MCDGACGGAQFNISVLVGFKCTFDKRSLVSKVSIRMYLRMYLAGIVLVTAVYIAENVRMYTRMMPLIKFLTFWP